MDTEHNQTVTRTQTKKERGVILQMAWPIVIEQVLLIAAGMVSMMLTGTISGNSIAAVGTVNQILGFLQSMLMMMTTGAMVLTARYLGENKVGEAQKTAEQSVILSLGLGGSSTVLCLLLASPILRLLLPYAEATLFSDTMIYYRMLLLSFPGFMIHTVLSGVLRGSGDTRSPMIISFLANGLQLILAWLFIFPLNMGLNGAGLSLVIARTLSAIMAFTVLAGSRGILRIQPQRIFRFDFALMRRILTVGMPSSIEKIVIQAGNLLINALVVGMGTLTATAYQVTTSVNTFVTLPNVSLNPVATTLVSRHLGEGEPRKAKMTVQQILLMGGAVTLAISLIMAIFSDAFSGLYTKDADVLRLCNMSMWMLVICSIPTIVVTIMAGTFLATGDSKFVMLVSTIGVWVVRIPVLYLCSRYWHLGLMGVYISLLSDYTARCILFFFRFRAGRWMTMRL